MNDRLEQAKRHVRTGEEIVERQRVLIAVVKANGGDITLAEQLLAQFEVSLRTFRRDLETLKGKDNLNSGD